MMRKAGMMVASILKTVGVIILIMFTIILFSYCCCVPVTNDIVAENTAKKLKNISLPPNTTYIESQSMAGKLSGNGNGMQYFGAILIKSELSLGELQSYYSTYAENEQKYTVKHQIGNEIEQIEHSSLLFQSKMEGDNYFIVYSWGYNDNDSMIQGFLDSDLRGH